ncbi:peroxisomal assembly protein [Cladophialophora chaetospira]|uniref:L-ornithine N(5)-monooxygenase n=1 Tax=Cladophialophora chaetospira TaxID=386627 RepID=A0AA38XLD4_9EURO|nr:peroxisomal assembly protein [Cladophialophora chaetospira]
MQISFIKDLATLRDPTSQFTFLNYLKQHDRLVRFSNLGTFLPSRLEFDDYLQWAASHFENVVEYSQEVERIYPHKEDRQQRFDCFEIVSRNVSTGSVSHLLSRNVVIAAGGRPAKPAVFPPFHPRILHSSEFNTRIEHLLSDKDTGYHIGVVGGGQSAAEVFTNLHSRYPNATTRMIFRDSALRPSDDSPFVNEVFNPEAVDAFFEQPENFRSACLKKNKATNYSVVRLELLEKIYDDLYLQSIKQPDKGRWQHQLLPSREVLEVVDNGPHARVDLRLRNLDSLHKDSEEQLSFDAIILATGYRRDAHIDMLNSCQSINAGSAGEWKARRDYGLKLDRRFIEEGMDSFDHELEHPKKRRRRELEPRPLLARLAFDDTIKGDAAIVPQSLWRKLIDRSHDGPTPSSTAYIALTPRSPLHNELQESTWTLLSARQAPEEDAEHANLIRLAPTSSACQSLLKTYAAVERDRHPGHVPKSIEIQAIATKPLSLDSIYVSVEKGLLEKIDDIQAKFGGGFQYRKHLQSEKRTSTPNGVLRNVPPITGRLAAVVREALSHLPVVHSGDVFPLPLPAHPITHVRPPPAIVVECEPVSQGQVTAKTKIVLIQTVVSQEKALNKLAPVQPIIEESLEDTAEDTSNDQFYSAAEDRHTAADSDGEASSEDDSGTDNSHNDGSEEGSDDSDDSMDDMISLSAPGLPPQQAGTLSAMTLATPRPGDKRATGIQTPGSIYSSFTSATARGSSRPGKVFRTEALLRKVPIELMHPKPSSEDDEESFVFVDTSTLAKIGCFSGDWVRIEIAKNVSSQGVSPLAIKNLTGLGAEEESDWRAVRVFGLSGLGNVQPRYAVDKTGDRRSSFSQRDMLLPFSPAIYLSPVLLANLSNARYIKLGALPTTPRQDLRSLQPPRSSTFKSPPVAKEVVLSKIADPTTTNPSFQSTLFSSLQSHLQSKKRVMKKGDLIAVPVDQELGKAITSHAGPEEPPGEDDSVKRLNTPDATGSSRFAIAWFSIQQIHVEQAEDETNDSRGIWGGVVTLDSMQTRASQSGSSVQAVSQSTETWSRHWFGIAKLPQPSSQRVEHIPTAADIPPLDRLPLETRLSGLISAAVSNRAISLGLPPLVILLYSTQRQIGKSYIAKSACTDVGVHIFPISAHDLLSENASTTGGGDTKTEALLRTRAERALSGGAQQTALLIQHIDALTADRMVPVLQEVISESRVLIATTTKLDDIPAGVRSLFSHELEVAAPDEKAREVILRNACTSISTPLSRTINLKSIALQTAALVAGDLLDVVNRALLARVARLLSLAESQVCNISDVLISGGQAASHLLPSDFTRAITAARSTFSDAIGAPKIPTVTWKDVGGLSSQKDAIMETISLPLTHPELFANGIRKRSGILFYGPPGTGKTLLAKAIATEFSLNFFSVKGPELLNMYIGESEANVRRVFQRARDARPCVVFFDELDSVAPKRGNQGDSGGVMDRIVSQLLAELDGMSGGGSDDPDSKETSNAGGVFVIGATNRPDLLDPALLRPGRFDKMLYLGVADSHDQQVTILKALTRNFTLAPDIDLVRVASHLPYTYTGADLYALCSDAMLKAITRKTRAVDERVQEISKVRGEEISTGYFFDHLATEEDCQVVVNEADFEAAHQELVGSVSSKELEHFERIRKMFEEQDITAGGPPKNGDHQAPAGPAPLPFRSAPAATPASAQHNHAGDPSPTAFQSRPQPQPAALTKDKGKGKQRESSIPNSTSNNTFQPSQFQRNASFHRSTAPPIGNPNSGNSSDADNSDFGVISPKGMAHMNGRVVNGPNGTISATLAGIDKGKGKGKEGLKQIEPEEFIDGFVDGVEGDDEGLYDD